MSGSVDSTTYDHADKREESNNGGMTGQLERLRTAGGHPNDRTQPSLRVVHRRFANPAPLGLLSFATGIFLISIFGVKVRGVSTPNLLISVLIFFGGVCQFISGIMEFVSGNTFGATVFPAYGAFNLSYALIYLPGSGIITSYIDATTGELNSTEFGNALAMYLWAWFIFTVIFTVAAMRSSWILFLDLFVLYILLMLLACGYMLNNTVLETAGSALGFVVAILSYWAGMARLVAGATTPFEIPSFQCTRRYRCNLRDPKRRTGWSDRDTEARLEKWSGVVERIPAATQNHKARADYLL